MGTTAPEIGHAVLQTVAVLTSNADAGQREKVVLDCLYLYRPPQQLHRHLPLGLPLHRAPLLVPYYHHLVE